MITFDSHFQQFTCHDLVFSIDMCAPLHSINELNMIHNNNYECFVTLHPNTIENYY
jgi:hypothetical protein